MHKPINITLQAGRSRVRIPMRLLHFFLIYLILPAALSSGVYSVSNTNEYQKQKKKFLESKVRPAHNADNLTAICEPIF
jgi:hypothetical protein